MRHAFIISFTILASCSPPAANAPPASGTVLPASLELARDPALSGPEDVILTFIEAAAKKDADVLSQCFSIRSDKEFQAILEKNVSADDLSEIAGMFKGASIVKTTMGPDGVTAVVKVKLEWEGREFEEIRLHAEGSAWKITSF
ncbi:MAG: hypothetical protein JRG91_13960 [Deltaproteobacteria bacterium]|nr:hypothetical protein [Deltaproteobacteria bacterium]